MDGGPLEAVPMVAGLGYVEHLRTLPAAFPVRLEPEPDNRYNPKAVAVLGPGDRKIGYIAPEVARHLYQGLLERRVRGEVVECPAQLAGSQRMDETGIAAVLDLTGLVRTGNEAGGDSWT